MPCLAKTCNVIQQQYSFPHFFYPFTTAALSVHSFSVGFLFARFTLFTLLCSFCKVFQLTSSNTLAFKRCRFSRALRARRFLYPFAKAVLFVHNLPVGQIKHYSSTYNKKKQNKNNANSIPYSQAVTHPSTNGTRRSLTSGS